MTDPPSTLHSQTAQSAQATADSTTGTANAINAATNVIVSEEPVEDFTLKCICGYTDAEQHTVYCEACDTWQHTECYYIDATGCIPTTEVLDHLEHWCVDCKPRALDVKGATERQRNRQEEVELNERKIKKNAAKSHKKKTKSSDTNGILTNGWAHGADSDGLNDRTSRSPRDSVPATKRPKTSHRSSNSVNITSSSHHGSSNSHNRAPSAIITPSKFSHRHTVNGHEKDIFSPNFLCLYDNDPGDTPMRTNLLNDIHITSDLSLWSNDIEALRKATPKFSHPDIFQRLEQPISSMQMPELCKQEKVNEDIAIEGRHPRWKYLTINAWTPKGAPVGEIKGKIGHMTEYTQNPSNRWEYLRHPAPFVFFHPRLPIYIDTRSEGTTCRYLRRSCAPNLAMKTFLENENEYHFCFVAQCDLDPGSELTIGWVPDENMRRFFDPNHNGVKQEIGADQEEYIADWASKVLPEFGGCACGGASHCTWTRFAKRSHAARSRGNGHTKASASISANQVTANSREASDQDDRRSTTESKSMSRDGSPSENHQYDGSFAPGLEISAREKRKIAALERNFEQLENDRNQPATKKKKRNSGGSNANTPGVATSKQLGHNGNSVSQPNTPGLPSKAQYTDSSTSHRRSGSPISRVTANPTPRPKAISTYKPKPRSSLPNTPIARTPSFRNNYVSTAVQTDPEPDDQWGKPPQIPAPPSKPYISLTKRLLMRSQQERQILEQRRRNTLESLSSPSTSSHSQRSGTEMPPASVASTDIEMPDAHSAHSPNTIRTPTSAMGDVQLQDRDGEADALKTPAIGLAHNVPQRVDQQPDTNGISPPDLPGQPPPKPPDMTGSVHTETPTSSVPHSPLATMSTLPAAQSSNLVQPSPVPKKLSLSEYLRRKGSTSHHDISTSGSPEMTHSAFKPPLAVVNGDSKMIDDNAIVDSPKKEIPDPIGGSTGVTNATIGTSGNSERAKD